MGCETMHWIRAECTRPQSGNTTRRIIGLPKTGPSHAPAELRPFFIVTFGNTLLNATAIRRKRGPSLSRRIGQTGNVFQHGHTKEWNPAAQAYGRYWIDTPERRRRRTVTLGICPSRSLARRKLREHIEREGIIRKELQRRPTLTEAEVMEVLASAKRQRYAMLFALLAGTGLRIGEALAVKSTDLVSDCRVLHVRRSIWNGQEQEPKTPNAVREVDIPEPLARLLRGYVAGRTGYLFATRTGRPLGQRNVLRALHGTGKKVGFHAFRRFRTETLRRAQAPEDLTKLWLGHSLRAA